MINYILYMILILAIPVGFLVAWMARDELLQGRKWFIAICWVSAVLAIIFLFLKNQVYAFSLGFIFIVSLVSYWKSFDKKWTKKKI
ncbi:MAG: hypothetical protein WCK90_05380 [archaeon]